MDVHATTGLIEQVNEQLDPVALLQRIGYEPEKIQAVAGSVKAFCPIHRDTRFRSLLIDAKKKTFKCTNKTCRGYEGGTLVELFAIVQESTPLAAATELSRLFGLAVDTSYVDQVAASLVDEAERAFVDHDHERAEAAARQALEFRSDLIEARLLLASILAAKGERAQACDEFIAVADHYLRQEKYEDADRVLERATLDFPDNEDLLLLKVQSAELQQKLELAESLLLDLAQRRESSGRKIENAGVYEKLSTLFPDKPTYLEKAAEIYLERREFDKAITTLNNLAFEYSKQGNHADIVRVVEKAAAIQRPQAGVQKVYVEALVALGEIEKARSAVHDLILVYIETTMFFDAQQEARRWAEIEPESPEVHEWLGLIWQEQANGPEAAREFREAAHLAAKHGEIDRAIGLLGQARFNEPENTDVRWDLIGYLRQSGEDDQAYEELCALADYLFATGDTQGGERAVLQALEIRPVTAVRLELAPLLAKHGCVASAARLYLEAAHESEEIDDVAGAVACYQSYLELQPEDLSAKLRYAELLWEAELLRLATTVTLELLSHPSAEREAMAARLLPRVAAHPPDDTRELQKFLSIALDVKAVEAARQLIEVLRSRWSESDAEVATAYFDQIAELLPEDAEIQAERARWRLLGGDVGFFVEAQLQLAQSAEERGDIRVALNHLNLAMEQAPDRLDLVRRRADLLACLDDPELARAAHRDYLALLEKKGPTPELLEEYRAYLSKWPDDSEVQRALALTLEATGDLEQARGAWQQLLAKARLEGDLTAQNELLAKLISLEPANLALRFDQAEVLAAKGETSEALTAYRDIIEHALGAGELELAEKASQNALLLAPTVPEFLSLAFKTAEARQDFEAQEQLAKRLAKTGDLTPLITLYKRGVEDFLAQGKASEARALAEKWLALRPDDPESLQAAAKTAEQSGDASTAANLYAKLGSVFTSTQNLDDAVQCLQRSVALVPGDRKLLEQLAEACLAARRVDDAAATMVQLAERLQEAADVQGAYQWLKRAQEIQPENVEILRSLAQLADKLGDASAARTFTHQLLELHKSRADVEAACELYSLLLASQAENTDLQREFGEYLEAQGRRAEAKKRFIALAQTLRQRNPLEAIPYLGRAISLYPEPGDAAILVQLADLYIESRQYDFAVGSLRDAVQLYESEGRLEDAVATQQRICELSASTLDDWIKLGDLEAARGEREKALRAYRQAYSVANESSLATRDQRAEICRKILSLDPTNLSFALSLVETLAPEAAASWALEWLDRHGQAVGSAEQRQLLEVAKRVAPRHIGVRRTLVALLRQQNDHQGLADELFELCEMVGGKEASEVRRHAIQELRQLPLTDEQTLKLAQLSADLGDTEYAVESYTQVAEQLIDAGKWELALQAVQAAMALDPSSLSSALVAKLYRASHGDERAKDLAQRAFDAALLARSRTRALVVSMALLEAASYPEARDLFERTHQKAGAAFLVAIAQSYLSWLVEQKRSAEVAPLLGHIIMLASNSPETWYLAAQIYRLLGDAEKAAEASRQAARLFAQAGAVTEEENCYREVLELCPDDIPTLETLVGFYERERRRSDVLDLIKKLIDLTLEKADAAAAAKWITKYLEYDPGNLDYREKLVEQLVKAGEGEKAVEAQLELARMLRNLKFTEKAAAAYERALVLDPANDQALTSLYELADELGDSAKSERYVLALAEAKLEAGHSREAIDLLRSFVERHPGATKALDKLLAVAESQHDQRTISQALRNIGYQRAKTGDLDGAISAFEKLRALQPDNREVLRFLLDAYSAEKKLQQAADIAYQLFELEAAAGQPAAIREAALTVLAFDEKRANVRQKLAATLADLGEKSEAVRQWWLASEIYMEQKAYTQAIECLQATTALDPSHIEAWRRYADLLALTGDELSAADARIQLASALVDKGQTEEACRVLERISERRELDASTRERMLAVYRRCGIAAEILPEIIWLANYYINRRDFAKAEQFINEGLEIDPEDLSLLECRIEIARRLGRTEEMVFRLRELAQKYLDQGDHAKAAALLRELVQQDQSLVDVRLELARIYEHLQEPVRAHEEYLEAIRYRLAQGEREEARQIADQALAMPHATPEFRARIAEIFAEHGVTEFAGRLMAECAKDAEAQGQLDKALRYLERVVEYRPKWIDGHQRLADVAIRLNRPLDALRSLEVLTELLLDQKRLREAADVLRRRIQLAPKEIEPRRQLIEILEILGEREVRFQQLQEYADLLITRGEIEEAVEVYHQLAQLQPDDPALLSRYLELFAQIGDEREVLGEYERLAELYIKAGQFQEATRTFERILAIDRRQRDVREKFIQFLQSAGQRSRAITEMAKLAELCMAMGDSANAIRWLSNAHALNPTDLNILELLAEAYARAGNATAAAEHFYKVARLARNSDVWRAVNACRKVVELVPEHRPTREIFSELLMEVGERVEAAANARVLAELYREAGESELAEKQEKLAKEYEPESIASLAQKLSQGSLPPRVEYDYLVRLGDLYYQEGDVDRAIDAYRRARQIDNSNPELIRKYVNALFQISPETEAIADLIELAKSYEDRGAALRALEAYEQVLKIDSRNPIAKEGRNRMRKITNTE